MKDYDEKYYEREINLTEDFADKFDGRCFYDFDMSDRIEGFRFMKTKTGLDILMIGCDDHWGYSHVYHEDYGKYKVEDMYFGTYLYMIEIEHTLIKEIPLAKFDLMNKVVNEVMEEAEARENKFKEKQREVLHGLFDKD